jgi:alpha-tubulin suppressor-like RCC1 family protein
VRVKLIHRGPRRRAQLLNVPIVAGILLGGALVAVAGQPVEALPTTMVTAGGEGNVGAGQSCALINQSVWCWGDNSSGQLGNPSVPLGGTSTVPVPVLGLPPVVDISAGADYTCAVDINHFVWCWGDNHFGQLGNGTTTTSGAPQQVASIQAYSVSAGGAGQTCAVTLASTVDCWGHGNEGQLGDASNADKLLPTPVKALTNVDTVAAGGGQTCALDQNGAMWCWGDNFYGQLGDGFSGKGFNSAVPVPVSGLDADVQQIATGTSDTCAILIGGDLKCWGENQDGELGIGNTTNEDVPTQATSLAEGVTQVSLGQSHSCAIIATPGATAVCWGLQSDGTLGNGQMKGPNATIATAVFGLSSPPSGGPGGPVELAAGFVHTCVVVGTGSVECWGAGFDGQIGVGNTENYDIPTLTVGLPLPGGSVGAVTSGPDTGCALNPSLTVDCWGQYVGDGTANTYDTAQAITDLPAGIAQVSAAYQGACTVTSGGGLDCWGDNTWGEVGNGTSGSPVTSPVAVSITGTVQAVSTGGQHACAVVNGATMGEAFCWGDNTYGGLGDGTTTQQDSPVRVQKLSRISEISAGQFHTCAIIIAGLVRCWGDNSSGELGDNSTSNSDKPVTVSGLTDVVQVAAGQSFTCALTNSGSVYCWGYNVDGELGDGTTTQSNIPVAVSGLGGSNPVLAIAAGNQQACAVLQSLQVDCWGSNGVGQLGNPSITTDSLTPVAVSGFTSEGSSISTNPNGLSVCGLNSSGQAYCWGDNTSDELGDGSSGGESMTPAPVQGL